MTDLATLGLEVKSDGVEQGARALGALSGAAKRAEAATGGVTTSMKGAASAALAGARANYSAAAAKLAAAKASADSTAEDIAAAKAARGLAAASLAAAKAENDRVAAALASAKALEQEAAAANTNAKAAHGMSSEAMSLQHSLRSTIEMMAMGIPPTQILSSQMSHLSYAMSGEGGLKGAAVALGQSLKGLLDPVALLGIGLAALAVVGLGMVNWGHAAAYALNELADVVQAIGPYAIAAAAALALMYGPAIIGGITAVSEAVLSLTAYLAGLAIGAAEAWIAMTGPVGLIIAGIALISAAVVVFRDQVTEALGVDIVGAAKDGLNSIIGAFVGGFNGIKDAWSALPGAIGDIAFQAAAKVVDGLNVMIKKAGDGIDWLIKKANAVPGINVPLINAGSHTIDIGANPYAGAASDAAGTIANDMAAAQGQDYVGQIGTGIHNMVSGAASELRDLAKEALTLGDKAKKTKHHPKSEAEKMQDRYANVVQSGQNYIATQEAERDALGMTDVAAASLAHTQDLLNRAASAHIKLTPQQTEELTKLGAAMGAAEVATQKAKEAFEFAKDATKGFLSSFTSAIEQGKNLWQAFGDAANSVLDKVISKIEDNLVDALFSAKDAGGASGGIFGMLGSIFGFGGGGGDPWAGLRTVASANGNVFSGRGISAYSSSIVSKPTLFPFARGVGLMGEAGPEAIMPLRRGPDGRLGVAASGGGQPVTVHMGDTVIQIDGSADKETVARMKAMLDERDQKNRAELPRQLMQMKRDNKLPAFK